MKDTVNVSNTHNAQTLLEAPGRRADSCVDSPA